MTDLLLPCKLSNTYTLMPDQLGYYISMQGQHLKIYDTEKRLVDSAVIHLHEG